MIPLLCYKVLKTPNTQHSTIVENLLHGNLLIIFVRVASYKSRYFLQLFPIFFLLIKKRGVTSAMCDVTSTLFLFIKKMKFSRVDVPESPQQVLQPCYLQTIPVTTLSLYISHKVLH